MKQLVVVRFQMAYNEEHGIVPQTIKKEIRDLISIYPKAGWQRKKEDKEVDIHTSLNRQSARNWSRNCKARCKPSKCLTSRTARTNPRYDTGSSLGSGGDRGEF